MKIKTTLLHYLGIDLNPNTHHEKIISATGGCIGIFVVFIVSNWFVELGTISGGTFTALPAVDSDAASWSYNSAVSGALLDTENFNDNVNDSTFFGYKVGGRLVELTVDATDAVTGQNIAVRFGVTSSASNAG